MQSAGNTTGAEFNICHVFDKTGVLSLCPYKQILIKLNRASDGALIVVIVISCFTDLGKCIPTSSGILVIDQDEHVREFASKQTTSSESDKEL